MLQQTAADITDEYNKELNPARRNSSMTPSPTMAGMTLSSRMLSLRHQEHSGRVNPADEKSRELNVQHRVPGRTGAKVSPSCPRNDEAITFPITIGGRIVDAISAGKCV